MSAPRRDLPALPMIAVVGSGDTPFQYLFTIEAAEQVFMGTVELSSGAQLFAVSRIAWTIGFQNPAGVA